MEQRSLCLPLWSLYFDKEVFGHLGSVRKFKANEVFIAGATKRPTVLINQMRKTVNFSPWRLSISHSFHNQYFCLKENYNKKIAPFSFDRAKNANIPVTINVSMSVIDILKIEEVDHVYTLKFGLVLEW